MISTKTLQKPCRGCVSKGQEETLDSRWWLPGIVVVELKQGSAPGPIFGSTQPPLPSPSEGEGDLSWVDTTRLRQLTGGLLVKPPDWTFSFKPGQVPSRANYKRFITLNFRPEVNIPAIAEKLSQVRGVVRATPEPILSPPIPRIPYRPRETYRSYDTTGRVPGIFSPGPGLRNEPLAVSGGQSFGIQATVGNGDLLNQWYLFRSGVDAVVENGFDGAGVVVAVVDWGFNIDHQELQNRIQFKYNSTQDNDDLSSGPNKWHGTASLGLIGAGDNNAGMLGFACGAELWALMGQDSGSTLNNKDWAQAIEKAREQSSNGKRKVLLVEASAARGFNVEFSPTLREPIKAAIEDGCVVCVPAGNRGVDAAEGPNGRQIPETSSILVGATQYSGDEDVIIRGASNWGSRIVVSAPGELHNDVTCCDCGTDSYTNSFGGTSGASAKVAGAMALVLQKFPEITHHQIVEVLKTKMPQIPTTLAAQKMGCFLDLEELMTKIESYLAEQ